MTDMDDLVMMAKNLGGALQKMAEERNQASEKLRDEHLRQFFVVPGGERPVRLTLLLDRCQRAVGHMNDTLGRMSQTGPSSQPVGTGRQFARTTVSVSHVATVQVWRCGYWKFPDPS